MVVAKLYPKTFEILICLFFIINKISLAICSPCWLQFKNSNLFSFNTQGITILHWIFDVLVIIGNHCWRRGGIGLKSKITTDSYLILEE